LQLPVGSTYSRHVISADSASRCTSPVVVVVIVRVVEAIAP
jgi:hypothetical protein